MKYEYFISFSHSGGFGNCLCTFNRKIDSIEQVNWMIDFIKSNNADVKNICILNFILLREID